MIDWTSGEAGNSDAMLRGALREAFEATPSPLGDAGPDFELLEELRGGGQGTIFRARQKSLNREVAVKIPTRGMESELRLEGNILAALEHPNIVPVHLYDDRESPVLLMRLVRGRGWDDVLRKERKGQALDGEFLRRQLAILGVVCDAVAYAHSRGFIHCDLKPGNVHLGDFGEVYLLDWGMALYLGKDAPLDERTGERRYRTVDRCELGGTPMYMAPEMLDPVPGALGRHTDVYLLGAILYEILAGQPPHAARNHAEARGRALRNHPADPPPECPAVLVDLVRRALASESAGRPGSVAEFHQVVQNYLFGTDRQQRSRVLAGEVHRQVLVASSYADFTETDSRLREALELWPENPEALADTEELLKRWIRAARAHGDLVLARVQCQRLRDAAARSHLLGEIEADEEALRRGKRQQRVMKLVAVAAVVAVLIAVTVTAFSVHQRQLADMRAQATVERTESLRRRASLVSGENKLVEEYNRLFPLPDSLEASGANDPDPDRVAALDARREKLRSEREAVTRQFGGGFDPEPVELLLGEANELLARADTPGEIQAAAERYRDVSKLSGALPAASRGEGIAWFRLGQYPAAARLLEESAKQAEERFGAGHPEHGKSLQLAAAGYSKLGEDTEARRLYTQSRRFLEPQWREMGLEIARQSRGLADYDSAIQVSSSLLNAAPPTADSGRAWDLIGLSHLDKGELRDAREAFDRAAAILNDTLGPASVEALLAQFHRARVLEEEGEWEEAEPGLASILANLAGASAADYPGINDVRVDLCKNLMMQGKDQVACDRSRQTAAELRAELGAEHPRVAEVECFLALSLARLGCHEEATQVIMGARKNLESILGPLNPTTISSLSYSAIIKQLQGDSAGAFEDIFQQWQDYALAVGPTHPDALASATDVSIMLQNLRAPVEAAEVAEEALELSLLSTEPWGSRREIALQAIHAQTSLRPTERVRFLPVVRTAFGVLRSDDANRRADRNFLVKELIPRHIELIAVLLSVPEGLSASQDLTVRAKALADITGLPADSPERVRINGIARTVGVSQACRDLAPPPTELKEAIRQGTSFESVYRWLDSLSPDVNWDRIPSSNRQP